MNTLVIINDYGKIKDITIYDDKSTPKRYVKGDYINTSMGISHKPKGQDKMVHADVYWDVSYDKLSAKRDKLVKELMSEVNYLRAFSD